MRSGPCGSSDIWISRAIRSSCSSRSFSAFCCSRSSMLAVIELNDSASSPSWSRVRMGILCVKSPWRTRSVPAKSSWTDPVIERASASPMPSATTWMTRNNPPTTPSSDQQHLAEAEVADRRDRRRRDAIVDAGDARARSQPSACPAVPVFQSR